MTSQKANFSTYSKVVLYCKLGVKIASDMKVLYTYNMGNTFSLVNSRWICSAETWCEDCLGHEGTIWTYSMGNTPFINLTPAEPEMNPAVKIAWDMRVVCTYSKTNTSFAG